MQNLDIKFKGKSQKIHIGNMNAFAIMPVNYVKKDEYQEIYERRFDNKTWRYSHESLSNKDDYYRVYLSDDGKITYEDKKGKVEIKERFDPHKQVIGKIGRATTNIDILKKSIKVKELTNLDAEDILKIRRSFLDSKLKVLGILSFDQVNDYLIPENGYFSLRRIASEMEKYSGFPYVLSNRECGNRYGIDIDINDENKGLVCENVLKLLNETKDTDTFIQNENINSDTTNNIVTNYRKDMHTKINPAQYDKYVEETMKLAKVMLGLNYDILSDEEREGIKDLRGLSEIEVQDEISNVIDTKDFAEACDIEDRFVIDENDRYIERINSLGIDDDIVMSSSVGKFLDSQRREAQMSTSERKMLREKYDKMRKLYDAKQIRIIPRKNEREER